MALKKKAYVDADSMVAGINDVVKANAPSVPDVAAVDVDSQVISVSDLRKPPKVERRTASITIRVTPTIKQKFDELCKAEESSQADMFAYWVETASK